MDETRSACQADITAQPAEPSSHPADQVSQDFKFCYWQKKYLLCGNANECAAPRYTIALCLQSTSRATTSTFLFPSGVCSLCSHLIELFAASSVSLLIGYLPTLLCEARHIRLIRHYFAIINFFFFFFKQQSQLCRLEVGA